MDAEYDDRQRRRTRRAVWITAAIAVPATALVCLAPSILIASSRSAEAESTLAELTERTALAEEQLRLAQLALDSAQARVDADAQQLQWCREAVVQLRGVVDLGVQAAAAVERGDMSALESAWGEALASIALVPPCA